MYPITPAPQKHHTWRWVVISLGVAFALVVGGIVAIGLAVPDTESQPTAAQHSSEAKAPASETRSAAHQQFKAAAKKAAAKQAAQDEARAERQAQDRAEKKAEKKAAEKAKEKKAQAALQAKKQAKADVKKEAAAKAEAKKKAAAAASVDPEVENATSSAEDYLAMKAFSRDGLIDQLSSSYGSGYSKSAATTAVDSLHVDWNEQAYKAGKAYLAMTSF